MNPEMNIWVEPLDWKAPDGINETDTGADSEPPIKQIVVSAHSFYGEYPAKGGKCVETPDSPCKRSSPLFIVRFNASYSRDRSLDRILPCP